MFGGPAWKWQEERQEFYLHQFDPKQPDLNYENPDVVEEMKVIINKYDIICTCLSAVILTSIQQPFCCGRKVDESHCHLCVQIIVFSASTLECLADSYETFREVFLKHNFLLATQKWETLQTSKRRNYL